MKDKKRLAIVNLVAGYILSILFVVLIFTNLKNVKATTLNEIPVVVDETEIEVEEPIVVSNDPKIIVDSHIVYKDHLNGIVLNESEPIVAVVNNDPLYVDRDVIRGDRDVVIDDTHRIGVVVEGGVGGNGHIRADRVHHRDQHRTRIKEDVYDKDVDLGLLDKRIAEQDLFRDDTTEITKTKEKKFGLDKDGVNLANLTVANNRGGDDDAELGEVDLNFDDNKNGTFGLNKGELYAYNFPSQGVGAGIGNSAVGAGSGAGAGLGAGIGEGVYNGETVPTLGGVGTYRSVPLVEPGTGTDSDNDGLGVEAELALGTDPNKSDSDGDGYSDGEEIASYTSPSDSASNPGAPGSSAPSLGGVGGLISGAGSGVAAGLVIGEVKPQLGIPGIAPGVGVGVGNNRGYGKRNYDLPKDGALHIMMHVDGSGSILNTRKQLEIMKNTLLKKELLPYYNNDENLYNKRVTIVDGNGERTLQFFADAAKKDNVLALVFQDEAQPAYHLPNFNKKPEDHYMDDLDKLKNKLNGYGGLYRGIMFQVDRGKTFAKSFKEFVGNAFQGTGYLEKENLKKYYYQDNQSNIKNKNGIVFSDEYHTKDEGDPQYYMDLILNASKKIGIDLKATGAGLTDGKYNKKTQ
jgi:hypothetical protein